MFKRLLSDFQLSIITLMSLFAFLALTPYVIYRGLQGNWLVAGCDAAIVLCALIAVFHAWRTGDTVKPGIAIALVVSFGGVLITLNIGVNGLFWIYVLILFNFFMVTPLLSLLLTLGTLTCIIILGRVLGNVFESDYQLVSFLVTSLTASLFAMVFAMRTRTQRDRLELLATLDPLTGAGNRRSMDVELDIAIAAQQRYGGSRAVLAMDLDHFKQVNDTYGHSAGDKVLMDFVELIRAGARKDDRLFRFGGEEFLLLLPNVDPQALAAIARNLQSRIGEKLRDPCAPVTVSMGGALLRPGETADSWLRRADAMLYQAKNAGRNCVFIEGQQLSDC